MFFKFTSRIFLFLAYGKSGIIISPRLAQPASLTLAITKVISVLVRIFLIQIFTNKQP